MPKVEPADLRFWNKISSTSAKGCWLWPSPTSTGYGLFWFRGKYVLAHRWAYEKVIGPIPVDFQLHHSCENRACVNPFHLEPKTPLSHSQEHPKGACSINRAKTHCPRGHPFSGKNLVSIPNGRACRICRAYKSWKSNAKKSGASDLSFEFYFQNSAQRLRTHCKNGHLLSEDNIYSYKGNMKQCKTCHLLACKKYRDAKALPK
jgi:hypothetical protein